MKSLLVLGLTALVPILPWSAAGVTPAVIADAAPEAAPIPEPEIEVSSDGGANWYPVSGAGSAVGFAFKSATADDQEHYGVVFDVQDVDGSGGTGGVQEVIYRVSSTHVGASAMTWENTFGTRNPLTLTWDGQGKFVSVN